MGNRGTVHRGMVTQNYKIPRMSYDDIRKLMDRRSTQQKKGMLTAEEIAKIVDKWKDDRELEDLDPKIVSKEVKRLERKFKQYNVPMVGHIPEEKPDGVCTVMYCQLNNCSGKEVHEIKTGEIMHLQRKYDVNVACLAEIGFNFSTVEASRGLDTWFEDDREVRAVEAHNKHDPNKPRWQPGGTGIVCFSEFIQYAKNKSRDSRSLGRFCSWVFYANPMHRVRIVVAYNTCKSKPKGLKTNYQQILRYIQHKGLNTNPCQLFREDFCRQCHQWRKEGDRLIIFMDANEHILDGQLHRMLTADGMLEEFSHKYWGNKQPHSFIGGSQPIDMALKTKDVELSYFGMLPFSESPGDHRTMIAGVTTRSILGCFQYRVVRPISRRLVLSNELVWRYYLKLTDHQFDIHRIQERMDAVDNLTRMIGNPSPSWLQKMTLALYSQIREIRQHGENKCRKIRTPAADYSPTIQFWYDRIHAYQDLIKLRAGTKKYMDESRIVKFAQKHAIENPRHLTNEELKDGLRYSRIRLRQLRGNAKGLRKTHLRNCLIEANRRKRQDKAKAIKQRMSREHNQSVWWYIKRVVKDPATPPLLKVTRMVGNKEKEYEGQADVEGALQTTLEARFTFAHNAPIMKHYLGHKLRYLSDQDLATQIITGTYDIPSDLDEPTRLILEEIGKMGVKVGHEDGREIIITPADFTRFWKRVREFTSSGGPIHYSHYKAAARSESQSRLEAQQLTVIARSGIPPESWPVCLQVMLEKIAGLCLVERLRAIQLYDAQFNSFNAFVFGREAMHTLTDNGFLPDEHFSQKGCTAEDAKFNKTLTTDLSRHSRQPMAIASVDASNCYDWVNHVIMSLVWLALLGSIGAIQAALYTLQNMKFYQRTGYGESQTYFGGANLLKYIMGLGQGSRGAPPSWIQISSILVNIMRNLGCGAKIADPITRDLIHTIGALFVDDADLYVWDEGLQTSAEVWEQMQKDVDWWSALLDATGGALKPEKCFWYMLDYECVDGEWAAAQDVDYDIYVTDLDGTPTIISRDDVQTAKKTLGIHDSPGGGSTDHLDVLEEKMETWIMRVGNGHLPTHMAWTAYRLQLWTGLRYGIGTLTNNNNAEAACKMFDKSDYLMLPLLGIARTVKRGWRRIHQTFGGFGLYHFPTEQLISRLNLLMQHYHTSSPLSKKLDASLRYMQLQIGTNRCPFDLDYNTWAHVSPVCWVKTLWHTLQLSGVDLHLHYDVIPLPREWDVVLMEWFYSLPLTRTQIQQLNRCRVFLNVIFLSDIVTANGRSLESFMWDPGGPTPITSKYKFPREKPTQADWDFWLAFWSERTDEGFAIRTPLGKWKHPSHREWQWYYDEGEDHLYKVVGDTMTSYVPVSATRRTRSRLEYRIAWSDALDVQMHTGKPVSITATASETIIRQQTGPVQATHCPTSPDDFWNFLSSLGGEWMWEGLSCDALSGDNIQWLVNGMTNGSLIWIADGSYDRKRAPRVSGAGWVVYCKQTGRRLTGSFYELSRDASSYHAELLGLLALLHLCAALEQFYSITHWTGMMCCDNQWALYQASRVLRRIRPSAKSADILRNMRNAKNLIRGNFKFQHVDAHMDRYLLWHQLPLLNQLNCVCDQLAKRAVSNSIFEGQRRVGKQLLPREDVALIIRDVKLTSDLADPLRYEISKMEARNYLITEERWTGEQFDAVDWDWLNATLATKSDLYRQWLSKQHSGHCGTRVQVGYYSGESDPEVGCPCCGEKETAAHLCVCPDEDRTRLLQEMTADLETWMNKHSQTDVEIAYWVPKYILYRGTKPFAELGRMSPSMLELARDQDRIGWRNFMEGRISSHFYSTQNYHLSIAPSYLNGGDWMRQFIGRILHITHSQWIYRNFILHDHRNGYLRRNERESILLEIEKLADTNPDELPEESRFLLEIDFDRLCRSDLGDQQYWVVAMAAARKAGRRSARRGARAKRIHANRSRLVSRRRRMGILDVERQVRLDWAHCGSAQAERRDAPLLSQPAITSFTRVRPSTASLMAQLKSNKRYCNPD